MKGLFFDVSNKWSVLIDKWMYGGLL